MALYVTEWQTWWVSDDKLYELWLNWRVLVLINYTALLTEVIQSKNVIYRIYWISVVSSAWQLDSFQEMGRGAQSSRAASWGGADIWLGGHSDVSLGRSLDMPIREETTAHTGQYISCPFWEHLGILLEKLMKVAEERRIWTCHLSPASTQPGSGPR